MEIDTLRKLYTHELKDIYSAENQILKALPKMAKATKSPELRAGFEEHLAQTEGQVERLERIFEMLGTNTKGPKCAAMEGLVEECQELIAEKPDPEVLDAGLIACAQKVEHYEIASYGTVRTWAQILGEDEQAELLQETLDEEGETDKKLTELAESLINLDALNEGEDESETGDEESAPDDEGDEGRASGRRTGGRTRR